MRNTQMKPRPWYSTLAIAALALVSTSVKAQEKPAQTTPDKSEAAKEEKPEVTRWNEIGYGFTTFQDNAGLSQYAQPTQGLSLFNLSLFTPGTDLVPYSSLILRGMVNQDNLVDGYIALDRGNTILRARRTVYGYNEFDWRPKLPSEDAKSEYTLDHSFTTNVGGFAYLQTMQRDIQHPAPRDSEHMRTQLYAVGVGGKLLNGNLNLTLSDRQNLDDTGVQPNTNQRRIDTSYARDFGPNLSLEGTAGYASIQQVGLANSTIKTYAFNGALDLGPRTGLQLSLRRQDLDMPNIADAYARKRLETSARLMHRFSKWTFQFGARHLETERVRSDQSFVDVPTTDSYDARLSGRFGPTHVTFRGTWEKLKDGPIMLTSDQRALYWDKKAMLQAKIDWGGELGAGYGSFTYRNLQNNDRVIEVASQNVTIGGSYVFAPTLNGFAEYSVDNYRVVGGDSGQALEFYFPNSRSIGAGLNWTKSATTTASLSVNFFESGDVRGTQLTLSFRQRLSASRDMELIVAPWRRDDPLYGVTGFQTTFLSARFTERF